jgi:hypothetical protein
VARHPDALIARLDASFQTETLELYVPARNRQREVIRSFDGSQPSLKRPLG